MALPDTGSTTPSPPTAGNTSFTSSSGRYRAHLPPHILTDTTNRYPCFGDSAQNCCPALELSLGSCQPQSVPGQICASITLPLPTHTPKLGAGLSRCCCAPRPRPQEHLQPSLRWYLPGVWLLNIHPMLLELHLLFWACMTDKRQQEVCGAVR